MAKIRQSNLDNSIVTGLDELTSIASGDQTIIYDASSGALKKVSQLNFLNAPTVSSVSPTSVTSGDGTGNYTFTITGTGFTGASASLINNSGLTVNFDTVTVDSTTQITGVIAKSSLLNSGEPYDVRVSAANGLNSTLENQINIDASPTFNTASGSIGTVLNGLLGSTTLTVEAFDPESAGNVTFSLTSGSLPAGATATTVNENGVSKYQISGFSAVGSNTTSNFTLTATDVNSNTSSRAFSITVNAPVSESFTSSGTFSVPSGVNSVDVLVVAGGGTGGQQHGGGGGAGGLIFRPGFPVTPGGTVSVTVGCGGQEGAGVTVPSPNSIGQDSVFGTLTAKGGGGGAYGPSNPVGGRSGQAGGSGGGGGYINPASGPGTQPTQPGDSGAYGFGNPGGPDTPSGPNPAGGGGGGAGAAGSNSNPGGTAYGADGGIGKAYTISDGTTSVYYAGGGGGGSHISNACSGGTGGQGGGGNGGVYTGPDPVVRGTPGTANRGGGGGASGPSIGQSPGTVIGGGGKGIVIVRY